MCVPVLTAVSTLYGMQTAQAQANYQSQVYENNANLADQEARAVREQGTLRDQQIRRNIDSTMGSQKAAFSANGLDISAGSPLGVLGDTAYLGELDIQTNQYNTAKDVWSLGQQATQYRSAASAARASGRNAAIGTLLTGATSLASYYSNFAGNKISNPVANTANMDYWNKSAAELLQPKNGLNYVDTFGRKPKISAFPTYRIG